MFRKRMCDNCDARNLKVESETESQGLKQKQFPNKLADQSQGNNEYRYAEFWNSLKIEG